MKQARRLFAETAETAVLLLELDSLDAWWRFVKKAFGENLKLLGQVSKADFEAASLRGIGQHVEACEFGLQMQGAGGGGVDDAHAITDHFLEDRNEQRVVGASEEQGIDAFFEHRLEVGFEDRARGLVIKPIFLNQGHEQWRWLLDDHHAGSAQSQGVLVGMRGDGAAGGNDADAFRLWIGKHGFDTSFDHAEHGDAVLLLQKWQRVSGGRIAGYDNGFHVFRQQITHIFIRKTADGFGRLRAIGNACGIAEIDDMF